MSIIIFPFFFISYHSGLGGGDKKQVSVRKETINRTVIMNSRNVPMDLVDSAVKKSYLFIFIIDFIIIFIIYLSQGVAQIEGLVIG